MNVIRKSEDLNLLNQGVQFKAQLHCCSKKLRNIPKSAYIQVMTNHLISNLTHLCVNVFKFLISRATLLLLSFLLLHLQPHSSSLKEEKDTD